MNPTLIETLLQLHERSLKLGSPLLQLAFEKLVPAPGADGPSSTPEPGHSATAAPPSLLDALRSQQLILEEVIRIHALLLRVLSAGWSATAQVADQPRANAEPARGRPAEVPLASEPANAPETQIGEALKQMERLMLLHPVAAQAAFSALVAQGRRFAATSQGQTLASSLASSTVLGKLRRIWETTTLNMLEEQATTVLPSMYVEAIFAAAKSANLEDLLTAQRAPRSKP